RGTLSGKPPEATHCNNIGAEHRQEIYPVLRRWFDMAAPVREESRRLPAEMLTCLEPGVVPRPAHELAAELGAGRAEAARQRLAQWARAARRQQLREDWARLLGTVEPEADPRVTARRTQRLGEATIERVALEVEPNIVVPLLLLLPPRQPDKQVP